jgi:putative ABC transport system permease protein
MTAVGVVIAVISIINTMLMSVSERTIEFGILRANGWSRRDLLKLITAESSLIGIAGGILGAFFGWVATLVLNQIWPDRLHLYATPGLLAFSVAFATVLGLIGGLYPAWLAGRMVPMDAIRRG